MAHVLSSEVPIPVREADGESRVQNSTGQHCAGDGCWCRNAWQGMSTYDVEREGGDYMMEGFVC